MYRTVYSWREIYDDLLLTKPSLSIFISSRKVIMKIIKICFVVPIC